MGKWGNQMIRKVYVCLIIFFLFFNLNAFSKDLEPIVSFQGRPAVFEIDTYTGEPYLGYYINDETFTIKSIKRNIDVKVSAKGFNADGVKLIFTENEVLVAWRPKEASTGYKYLYFDRYNKKDLSFIDRKTLNTEKDVLLPINLYKNENNVLVSWVDERNTKMSTTFINFSNDSGKTFNDVDVSVGGDQHLFNSSLLSTSGTNYIFGTGCVRQKEDEKKCGIVVRKSKDLKNWEDGDIIEELTEWTPSVIDSVETSKGALVFWAGFRGLYCSNNYDNATGWHVSPLPKTEDMSISKLSYLKDKNSAIYLAASYKKNLEPDVKDEIFLYKSSDDGLSWSEPLPLRHYPYKKTTATNPDLKLLENGTLVLVWQDHRFIRGNIFMNYSKDGATWLSEDINLSQTPAGSKNDMYPEVKVSKNNIFVIWYQAMDDGLRGERKIFYKEVNL